MQGGRERESCVCFRGIERDLEREEEGTHFLPLSRALFRTPLVDLEGALGLTGAEGQLQVMFLLVLVSEISVGCL
jgi:hypothetical protein